MSLEEDVWYAINKTKFVKVPKNTIATFNVTKTNFVMVSELPDRNDKVCVRFGSFSTQAPTLILPESTQMESLYNFVDVRTKRLLKYMHEKGLFCGLKYGTQITLDVGIRKDFFQMSLEKGSSYFANKYKDDDATVVISGVEQAWEISILKFVDYYTRISAPNNFSELQKKEFDLMTQLEEDFCKACGDKKAIEQLGDKLQLLGLFEKYEERFFALLKSV